MYEKVNPSHPDKIADRIAGAFVDLAYSKQRDPKVAVEVLIGHNLCHIIAESSVHFTMEDALPIVHRIAGDHIYMDIECVPQDAHLAANQLNELKAGDNGIFKGTMTTYEQGLLADFAGVLYAHFPSDGKFIIKPYVEGKIQRYWLTVCQSNATEKELREFIASWEKQVYGSVDGRSLIAGVTVNPLGEWTGGLDVDTGATNRKLGSDMGDSVTGGGLHGKDLSKADVCVNIFCHLLAQQRLENIEMSCAIGDTMIKGVPYSEIVSTARNYIESIGGFEKLAEWGLIRPTV